MNQLVAIAGHSCKNIDPIDMPYGMYEYLSIISFYWHGELSDAYGILIISYSDHSIIARY